MQQAVAVACFAGAATLAAFFFAHSAKSQLFKAMSLRENNATARGTVIAIQNGPPLRLIYEFAPEGGTTRKYSYASGTKGLKSYSKGDAVTIIYAPHDPSINIVTDLFEDKLNRALEQLNRTRNLPWQTAIVFAITLWRVWVVYSSS